MKNKTWLITGASQGLGLETVKYLISQGNNVIAFSRNPETITKEIGDVKNLLALSSDLNSISDISEKINLALKKFNTIDIVLNNAGYGLIGPFEEISDEEINNLFKVNVFYTFNVIKAVLPILRKQKYGHIFNTSSVAGYRSFANVSVYSAVKFALDGFSEGLNDELKHFNISVSSILPGGFRTNFLESTSIKYADSKISDYNFETDKKNWNAINHQQLGNPKAYAKFIYDLTTKKTIPTHIFVGNDAIRNALAKIKLVEADIASYKEASNQTGFKDFKVIH
ncbi:3-phenylpropionate-dihydrodiol/cinnamic acid-dihydrodiol dehydrogenase [Spiroplasma sp. JKS002671]|uniref:SDR family oxidoreductase n=1 Tax=Spiroplasma attinicola TaxID=2904537 RepID=UPI002022A22F|nr:SDR family oxidoreductase [Spiroplasma sp. JKS002671]MCL8210450.1 3-phenylpropionate-dihydrodiol/cinnamic acid-dihydrodiol dehydrogenase [Spiroplasma sp. JKS002671]